MGNLWDMEPEPEDDLDAGLIDNAEAHQLITAGRATFTVVSKRTENRYTYKVSRPQGEDETCPLFVGLLNGATREYTYFANLRPDQPHYGNQGLRHGRKAKLPPNHQAVLAFNWLWGHIDDLPDNVEIWHEGRCFRCGLPLTDPQSIKRGVGPTCAEIMGMV